MFFVISIEKRSVRALTEPPICFVNEANPKNQRQDPQANLDASFIIAYYG